MKNFNLKHYPPALLISITCIISAINLAVKAFWNRYIGTSSTLFNELSIIVSSSSLVVFILSNLNKLMWKWWLKLIGLIDVRGDYYGKLISSYDSTEDSNENIELNCKVKIVQNVNGLRIEGDFFTDAALTQRSSSFLSSHEEIETLDNGNASIRYFFANKGNQLHDDNLTRGLTNHEGVAVLTFDVNTKKITGYYFNHERKSSGQIRLEPIV